MKELLAQYQLLDEETRNKIFTREQREIIERQIFFNRLFSDPQFYKTVETAVGETAYEELRRV